MAYKKKETVFVHISVCCNIDLTGIGHEDANMNYWGYILKVFFNQNNPVILWFYMLCYRAAEFFHLSVDLVILSLGCAHSFFILTSNLHFCCPKKGQLGRTGQPTHNVDIHEISCLMHCECSPSPLYCRGFLHVKIDAYFNLKCMFQSLQNWTKSLILI